MIEDVSVSRGAYLWERLKEQVVKQSVLRAARRRNEFGNLAVIPTDFVGLNVIANGLYERHELTIMRHIIESQKLGGTTALDIGANIGNHTIAFSKWFQNVIAFEPSPSVATLLEANMVLARCGNVMVQRVGLGTQDAMLPFTPDTQGNDGHGSFAISGPRTIELPVRNGDGILAEIDADFATGKRPIGFIKCDVEGFEASVFEGLKETLKRHAAVVVFESDQKGPGARAYNVLKECGYRYLYAIRETGDNANGKMHRELMRLTSKYRFWLEPLDDIPAFWSNVVSTKTPLRCTV
jgi:FkbM family methyltransferase